VNLTLSAPTGGATLGAQSTATLTITDNDVAPAGTIQFSVAGYSVTESGPTATITATRANGTNGAVGVTYATSNGIATAGSDYTAASGTLSWANGDSASKTFTVAITDDATVESSETVNLTLSAPTGGATLGAQSTATLTITDNDVAPVGTIQFSVAGYSVTEAGPAATITATRANGTNGAVGVTYATSNGTATAGSDYTAASGTLSWANGDSANKTFTVAILEDAAVEGSETVNLTLSGPTGGATLGTQQTAVLTITDNDNPPAGSIQFTASTISVSEGGSVVTITASRTGGTFGAIGATYATSNGTAIATSDYNAASGTLSWANGDSANKTFTVAILDDGALENAETFTATLTAPTGGASIGSTPTITVTINDNDVGPVFSIANVSPAESAGSVTLTVTKTGATTLTHAVSYATGAGTATAGSDYTTTSNSVSFAPGDTTKTFTVPILEDSAYEGNEAFTVALSGPTNGATVSGSAGTATVTINDNDTAPVFSLVDATVSEGGGTATVTVIKAGTTSLTHAVSYGTIDGGATSGSDYTIASGSLTFAPGDTSKTFSVIILEDTAFEGPEAITTTLFSATNGATVAGGSGLATGTINITDNESGPVFSIANVAPAESAGSVTLTVTKTGGTAFTHAVNYATAAGSATAGSDYTTTSGSLVFAAGDTSKTFTVPILDDSSFEGSESFTVALSSPTNGSAVSGTAGTATVTVSDNEAGPVFSIASASPAEASGGIALTITKTGTSALTHSVSYATSGGSATAGADYTAVSSSISFSPGETVKTINIPILDDSVYEGSENFLVTLSGATGGASVSGGAGQASVMIVDNESPPVFTTSNVSVNENAGTVTITVVRTGGTVYSHAVNYASASGTATSGSDFTAVSGTLTFTPSETSKTISVAITNDAVQEATEAFAVSLSSPTFSATLGSPSSATVSIIDDEPTATVSIPDRDVSVWYPGAINVRANYQIAKSGDIYADTMAVYFGDVGDWISPKVGMGNYEVRAAGSSVSYCGGPFGTWVDLASTDAWWFAEADTAQPFTTCVLDLQIRAKANPSVILDTATVTISLNVGE
jgi:hypothetical protein